MSVQQVPLVSASPLHGWENYPDQDKVYFTPGKERDFYLHLLNCDPAERFEDNIVNIEALHVGHASDPASTSVARRLIASHSELEDDITHHQGRHEQRFYLIPQLFSWGQLQITREGFQKLLASNHVFAPFLTIADEFRSKTQHVFLRRCSFHGYHAPPASGSSRGGSLEHLDSEVAYLLQYVEQNNRSWGDPWSLRQLAVYQQANVSSESVTWVVLHSGRPTTQELSNLISTNASISSEFHGTLKLHTQLLLAKVDNWGKYIEYLRSQLQRIDERASFSSVETKLSQDFSIEFADLQSLQQLRHKVLKVSSILDSCQDLATHLGKHFTSMNHSHNATGTMQLLEGTFHLVSKIIEYRNVERLREINQASERNMRSLEQSATAMQQESRAATRISVQNHKDSKMVKALALVSVVFLPSSLVATVFSSNLIQVRQDDTRGDHFVVNAQFWIYVVASLLLTLFTAGVIRVLEHSWLREVRRLAYLQP